MVQNNFIYVRKLFHAKWFHAATFLIFIDLYVISFIEIELTMVLTRPHVENGRLDQQKNKQIHHKPIDESECYQRLLHSAPWIDYRVGSCEQTRVVCHRDKFDRQKWLII